MSTITHDDVGEDLRRIVIAGRLDTPGTTLVASKLAELAAAQKRGLVVDLTGVDFLASSGMGALIMAAKAVRKREGRMVLVVGENSAIMTSLKTTGVDQLIPVFRSVADAERAALA